MLGKEIAHEVGQTTGVRIIEHPQHGSAMEVSFRAEGTLLGVHSDDVSTYVSWVEPDGSLRGEGRGLTRGENGEAATWEASGTGRLREDGGSDFRGALYYRSTTPTWSKLNGTCCVFEYSADAGGKTEAKLFLWE